MKTKLNLLAAGIFLAVANAGLAQPVITTQPQSQTNVVGTTALFWVEATGTEPLAYQWQKFVSASWSDLAARTNANLSLTNVQTSDAADYRVVITSGDGATNSDLAHLTILVPPRITPTLSLQNLAADVSTPVSFVVTASGTAPLSYQWRLDGHDLSGQTSNKLSFSAVQPADEGDYTVVVTNVVGAVTSEPARLWVVPPATEFIKGNLTNLAGVRLPYFYLLPTNYTATRRYPLLFFFHGRPGDETMITTAGYGYPGYANLPAAKVFASYRQQEMDPMILLWPVRRAGEANDDWSSEYLQLASDLLDKFPTEFSVDTNRVHVTGFSQGVNAAWDLMGMRPGFFAGAAIGAGWQGGTPAAAIKNVPLWAWCASNDGLVRDTRSFVTAFRRAGGNPIYTEYVSGGHLDGILMGACNPAYTDWLLSQRRGLASTHEPILAITNPTPQAVLFTGATNLNLTGSASALGRAVTQVAWTNYANNAKGVATGTNSWSVTNIPLVANKTNLIVVVGTTTSWAPAFGGNTTFNDTLTVIQKTNAAPSFTRGPDQVVLEDAGAQTVAPWATNISAGAPVESGQALTFLVSNDHPNLFSVQPALSPMGTLTYTPATNAYGAAIVTVVLRDDGGTENGGQDTSAPQTFQITVLPVNDAPVAKFAVSPLAEFPGLTHLLVIAPDGLQARVILNGSESSDQENDPLEYWWTEGANPLASGMIATHVFPIGSHTITLVVSDGQDTGAQSATVEIITPAESVGLLIALVEDSGLTRQRQRPLVATLKAAAAAFERGNHIAGLNDLHAFQNKVRAQVGSRDAVLADALTDSTQVIIQAIMDERGRKAERHFQEAIPLNRQRN